MLDLRFIRDNTELVRQAVASRQDTAPIDDILKLDDERRRQIQALDNLRRERKDIARK
jgi:seryl-tRNA synthetase